MLSLEIYLVNETPNKCVCVCLWVWVCECVSLTKVMSLEAAAALMWRLGCRTELLQSKALANVPTELWGDKDDKQTCKRETGSENYIISLLTHRATTRNWSICFSVSELLGSQIFSSSFSKSLLSPSPVWRHSKHTLTFLVPCEKAAWERCSQPATNLTTVWKEYEIYYYGFNYRP